jgi:formylmethanofuran dehydrogenase subunit E
MTTMDELLAQSATLHRHLCPRQVLGVRMGLRAGELLGLSLPQTAKRLLTFVETDGCFADGVAVATNCWVGHRTLRALDFGKVAATFVDTHTERAVRLHPHPLARERAGRYATGAANRWQSYLLGYQRMPDELLLAEEEVALSQPIELLLSRPSARAVCQVCGEEIINEREIIHEGSVLCRPCAGEGYYRPITSQVEALAGLDRC